MSEDDYKTKVREDGGPISREGGAGLVLDTERASATPVSPSAAPVEAVGTDEVPPGVEGPLERLQAWFSAVMTAPGGAREGIEGARALQAELQAERVEAIMRPDARLGVADRMAIYNTAYHSRLAACVADDYEGVGRALGEAKFDEVCRRYVVAHPSTSPNLNLYSAHFPAFVAEQRDLGVDPSFLGELARLEWAMMEVLHAPPVPPLDLSPLATASPEAQASMRLFPSPALRMVKLAYPANAWFQASLEGEPPPIPGPEASVTAVYRQDWRIWRMDFTPVAAQVIDALLTGTPLGEALGAITPGEDDGTVVERWFQDWVSSGFFSRLELRDQTT